MRPGPTHGGTGLGNDLDPLHKESDDWRRCNEDDCSPKRMDRRNPLADSPLNGHYIGKLEGE